MRLDNWKKNCFKIFVVYALNQYSESDAIAASENVDNIAYLLDALNRSNSYNYVEITATTHRNIFLTTVSMMEWKSNQHNQF